MTEQSRSYGLDYYELIDNEIIDIQDGLNDEYESITKDSKENFLAAALHGDITEMKDCIHKFSNKNSICDAEGRTPLHYAICSDCGSETKYNVVKMLLEEKFSCAAKTEKSNRIPLHFAVVCANKKLVQILLESMKEENVDVHANKDILERTALHYVSQGPTEGDLSTIQAEIASLLLESSSNPVVKDIEDATPLHLALDNNHKKIVEILLKNKRFRASLDDKDIEGISARDALKELGWGKYIEVSGQNTPDIDTTDSIPKRSPGNKSSPSEPNTSTERADDIHQQNPPVLAEPIPTEIASFPTRQTDLRTLIPEDAIDPAFRISSLDGWPKIEMIEEGRFGSIWKHKSPRSDIPVVGKRLKVSLFHLSAKEKEDLKNRLNKFITELKVLTKISRSYSNHLVQFLGCYVDSKKMILFTEWMPNGSVKDHIKEQPLDEPTALKYIYQATDGLYCLHHNTQGRNIHRDIRCANLLLTKDMNVKLADFGVAHDLAVDTHSFTIATEGPSGRHGNILFAAPEVLNEEQSGRRADIWSLGCTLVEMLTCQPPHNAFWEQHKERAYFLFLEQARGEKREPLQYNGRLLAEKASPPVQKLLDCLFIRNKKYRPTSEEILSVFVKADSAHKSFSIDIAKLDALYERIKNVEGEPRKWTPRETPVPPAPVPYVPVSSH